MKAAAPADAPVPLPISGELDLHTFNPRDVDELIPAYLEACAARHLREIRIIHGKGTGRLRLKVHTLLRHSPWVRTYRLGDERTGSWGATLVALR
ncbi:MAG: Smr/MutS family protein [Opitutales bacterium]|nr:Smr/MutS family protein [Opitutales bacterium]